MPKGRGRPLSRAIFIFLALFLLLVAGVNYYLLFLLGKEPYDVGKVKRTSILTAVGILIFIILLIVLFIFTGSALARAFTGKAGIISIFILLSLLVIMGLDFAIPPTLQKGNLKQARIFAIVSALFGTVLFIITLLVIILKAKKQGGGKKKGEKKGKRSGLSEKADLPSIDDAEPDDSLPDFDDLDFSEFF